MTWVEIHEYTHKEFDFHNRALAQSTRQALQRYGLTLWSCHGPAGEPLDLASSDPAVREHTCSVQDQALRVSADLGARVFVCDAELGHSEDTAAQAESRRGLYADSLRRLLQTAAQRDILLAVENDGPGYSSFVSPDDFVRLEQHHALPGLTACWDTGHGWLRGLAPEVACRLGSRLVTLHIHDNDGHDDRHWLPTAGSIPWHSFVAALRSIKYQGPFMMELVPSDWTPRAVRRTIDGAMQIYRRLVRSDGDA